VNDGQNSYSPRVPVIAVHNAINGGGRIEDSESKQIVRLATRRYPCLDVDPVRTNHVVAMGRAFVDQLAIGVGFLKKYGYDRERFGIRLPKSR